MVDQWRADGKGGCPLRRFFSTRKRTQAFTVLDLHCKNGPLRVIATYPDAPPMSLNYHFAESQSEPDLRDAFLPGLDDFEFVKDALTELFGDPGTLVQNSDTNGWTL
jgi:hypothetical protein